VKGKTASQTLYRTSLEHCIATIDLAFANIQILESQRMVNTDRMVAFCEIFNLLGDSTKFIPLQMQIITRAFGFHEPFAVSKMKGPKSGLMVPDTQCLPTVSS
jgi:hypothetical protein